MFTFNLAIQCFTVSYKTRNDDIVVLRIRQDLLARSDIFISTGNATTSEIQSAEQSLKSISQMWDIINNEWWKEEDGSKRKIMAECLVPDIIPSELIDTIYVANHTIAKKVRELIHLLQVSIMPESYMFFQPKQQHKITQSLYLIEGDMFFSQMQTLTISVNTVDVMGKGLASRAKYQFPDVYVYYQDICRKKILMMGKPALYKREAYFDRQLADGPSGLPNLNSNK